MYEILDVVRGKQFFAGFTTSALGTRHSAFGTTIYTIYLILDTRYSILDTYFDLSDFPIVTKYNIINAMNG